MALSVEIQYSLSLVTAVHFSSFSVNELQDMRTRKERYKMPCALFVNWKTIKRGRYIIVKNHCVMVLSFENRSNGLRFTLIS